jgi:hypothetical protein
MPVIDLLAGTALVVLTYLALRRFGPDLTNSTTAWVVIVAGVFFRGFFRSLSQTYIWYSLMPPVVVGAQWWAIMALYRRWRTRKAERAALGATLKRPAWQERQQTASDPEDFG